MSQLDSERRFFLHVCLVGSCVWAKRQPDGTIALMNEVSEAEGMNETEMLAVMDRIMQHAGFMVIRMKPVECELRTYLTPEQRKLINV